MSVLLEGLATGLPLFSFPSQEQESAPDALGARAREGPIGESQRDPPPPAPLDVVTLTSGDEPPPAPSSSTGTLGLYQLMEDLRSAGLGSADAFAARSSFAAASSFSFEMSFTHIKPNGKGDSGRHLGQMLKALDDGFQTLMSLDPEQGGRLAVLARVLAALNPDAAEDLLQTISDTLAAFSKLSGPALEVQGDLPVARTAPVELSRGRGSRVEMLHFELDFEMEISREVEFAVAQLRDEGIEVQAARLSETQRVSLHIEFTGLRAETQRSDPLVLDLSGDGVHLTGVEDGEDFDIDADGTVDRTAFVRGDDAFLALDRNGNGSIDDGAELFGDQRGALNGFEELRRLDANGDGRIDGLDPIFGDLRLLHDRDGDGRVARDEFSSLAESGIESLDLRYEAWKAQEDGRGNALAERSHYGKANGLRGRIIDAWVGYQ